MKISVLRLAAARVVYGFGGALGAFIALHTAPAILRASGALIGRFAARLFAGGGAILARAALAFLAILLALFTFLIGLAS